MNGNTWVQFFPKASDVNFVLRFRTIVLVVLSSLTIFLGYQLKNIKMAPFPLEAMYPTGHEFVPTLQAIQEMAPEPRMLVAILEVTKGDIYNSDTIRKIDRVTRGLMGIEGISSSDITSLTYGVDHLNNSAEGFSPEPILGERWPESDEDFQVLRRKVAVNAMGVGRYVSYDGTATMVTAELSDIEEKIERSYHHLTAKERSGISLEEYKKQQTDRFNTNLLESLKALKSNEDDADHTLYFFGAEVLVAQMTAIGKRDIPVASAVMLLVTVLLLAYCLRTLQGVLIPLITMIVSCIWSLGILCLCRLEFNPMALLFPLLLGLLSLVYSVLTLKQYNRLVDGPESKNPAIAAAYGKSPVTASILTAGLVSMSLFVSDTPFIKDLGFMGCFWLIGTFVAVVLINPVLVSFFPVPGREKRNRQGGMFQSLAGFSLPVMTGRGKHTVFIVTVLILALGGFFSQSLEVGQNTPGSSYVRPNHPWNQCFRRMEEKFIGPNQFLVHVKAKKPSGLLEPEAIHAIGDFSTYLKSECGARDSIAFDMMIKIARSTLTDGNPKWQTVPETREEIQGLAGMIMIQGGVEAFMDKSYSEATLSPFFPERDAEHINKYASRMQAYIESHPSDALEFSIGGGLLGMTKAINDGTSESYVRILAAAFVLLLICGTLVTGSFLLSVIVAVPIAAAQAILWMVMAASGTPISMPLVPVSAVAVGFGSVFGYQILRHMGTKDGEADGDKKAPRNRVREACGDALFAGFLAFASTLPWFFIGLKLQSHMALFLGQMIGFETIASMIFIPAWVRLLKPELQH